MLQMCGNTKMHAGLAKWDLDLVFKFVLVMGKMHWVFGEGTGEGGQWTRLWVDQD